MQPVRVGVIGLGRFGRLHALTLQGLAEAQLVALVARRQPSLDALSSELPGVPGWTDLASAIEQSAAEAWVVACTTRAHVQVAQLLLEAGKSVLLEKPIAEDLDEALSLQLLVTERNLMLGHILLFNSEFRELVQVVRARGNLVHIDCVRHRPASIVRDFPGESPLQAAMVHDLYCAQVLMEGREPDGFTAQAHRTADGTVDLVLAQLSWRGGPIAAFAASYLTPSGMPPRGFDRMEVFGEGWAARIESNPRPIEVWDESASWPLALEIQADTRQGVSSGMMAEELRCFCRVVRGEQAIPPGATFADGIQVQRWMDRLQSAHA